MITGTLSSSSLTRWKSIVVKRLCRRLSGFFLPRQSLCCFYLRVAKPTDQGKRAVVVTVLTSPRQRSGVLRSVCLSVCLYIREHISATAGLIFTKFVVQNPCGRGSVLLWRRCAMLFTSGFMDDVTFGRNGLYGDAWLAALRYRGGV